MNSDATMGGEHGRRMLAWSRLAEDQPMDTDDVIMVTGDSRPSRSLRAAGVEPMSDDELGDVKRPHGAMHVWRAADVRRVFRLTTAYASAQVAMLRSVSPMAMPSTATH